MSASSSNDDDGVSSGKVLELAVCEASDLALYLLEHRFSVCFDLQCSLHSIGLMVLSKVAE